jgi:hypothetical protein
LCVSCTVHTVYCVYHVLYTLYIVLRRMFGPYNDEVKGERRKLHNEDLNP